MPNHVLSIDGGFAPLRPATVRYANAFSEEEISLICSAINPKAGIRDQPTSSASVMCQFLEASTLKTADRVDLFSTVGCVLIQGLIKLWALETGMTAMVVLNITRQQKPLQLLGRK